MNLDVKGLTGYRYPLFATARKVYAMDELLKILKNNALETPENLAKLLDLSVEGVKSKIADYENQLPP